MSSAPQAYPIQDLNWDSPTPVGIRETPVCALKQQWPFLAYSEVPQTHQLSALLSTVLKRGGKKTPPRSAKAWQGSLQGDFKLWMAASLPNGKRLADTYRRRSCDFKTEEGQLCTLAS